ANKPGQMPTHAPRRLGDYCGAASQIRLWRAIGQKINPCQKTAHFASSRFFLYGLPVDPSLARGIGGREPVSPYGMLIGGFKTVSSATVGRTDNERNAVRGRSVCQRDLH